MDDIISKFSDHLKNALTRALCLVVESKADAITPIHLFWAIATQKGSVAHDIIFKSGVTDDILHQFSGDIQIGDSPLSHEQNFLPTLSPEARKMIEISVLTAGTFNHKFIGTEHLLSAILQSSPNKVTDILRKAQINIQQIEEQIGLIFQGAQKNTVIKFSTNNSAKEMNQDLIQMIQEAKDALDIHEHEEEEERSALEYFTQELTNKAFCKNITPVIGREKELQRLTQILSRKQKNNPLLIGEPGVGKTAIVEGLAKRIVEKNVPETLKQKRIFQLDLTAMIAGTMYRGEFEARLKQLVDEIEGKPNYILFIDEAHMLIGAGGANGSLDAANILKPALARGKIRCIGATTLEEYKKYIETDRALERRFQNIHVKEPNLAETKTILQQVESFFANFHGVHYHPFAINKAIELSERYLTNKQFPDKAIDLLDEAGARVSLGRKIKKTATEKTLEAEIAKLKKEQEQAKSANDLEKLKEIKQIERAFKKRLKTQRAKRKKDILEVNEDHIVETLAHIVNIPLQELTKDEKQQLKSLSQTLKKEVIGQDKAVQSVTKAIQRAKIGIQKKHRPLASFLFAGPSGVGKTHLAQTIAKELFTENTSAFLRLDMSEYSSPFMASKLIGSPAGYIGYRESTKLTDHIKDNPHSVILFDEIEKAHKDIHHLLLQILDNGLITDATGKQINFRNTIIILTSNAAQEEFKKSSIGFDDSKENTQNRIKDALKNHFSPELLNRLNQICIFLPLEQVSLKKIIKKELDELKQRFKEKDLHLNISASLQNHLLKQIKKDLGARDIGRVIEENVEHALIDYLLDHAESHLSLKVNDNRLLIEKIKKTKK